MIDVDALTPYWNLSTDVEDISSVAKVQLMLWSKGICIAGHTDEGKLVRAKAFATEDVYNMEVLREIVLNEPMLALPHTVRNIWIVKSRNILVPIEFAVRQEMDIWIQQLYYIEPDEELVTYRMPEYGLYCVFPRKKEMSDMMKQYFPHKQTRFLIPPSCLLKYFSTDGWYKCFIIFMERTCSLTLFKQGKLKQNFIFKMDTVEEVVVKIAKFLEGRGTELNSVELIVTGVSKELVQWEQELSLYFDKVNRDKAFNTTVLLETLATCEYIK